MAHINIKYQNFSLTNNTTTPILAELVDARDSVILNNPSEWEMSVVRFQVNGDMIPLFIPIIPDPAFPLRTNMSITLAFGGNYYQQFINVTADETKSGIYYYSQYLDHVNDALATSFALLKVDFPGASATSPPYFALNPVTQLISLYVQSVYLRSIPGFISISLNQYLQAILDFPYSAFNGYNTPNGDDYVIDVDNHSPLLPPPPRSGYPIALTVVAGDVIQVSQEFPTLHLWDNIKSIILLTDLIPIVRETLPNTFGVGQNNNISNNSLTILTDFDIVKNISEPRPSIIQYFPSAEYRMISMNQTNPYRVSDVRCQYQDYSGNIYPINLRNKANFSGKIMYRHKITTYK
jgi:hypothetical protein